VPDPPEVPRRPFCNIEERVVASKRLTVQQRKDIFRALVLTQDQAQMSVAESFQTVMKQFSITEHMLKVIQDEGIEKEWPPLDEAVQAVG